MESNLQIQPVPIADIEFYSKSATKSILCSSKKNKESIPHERFA